MRRILLALALALWPAFAEATVTVNNFNGLGTGILNEITKFDDLGNKVDALDGGIIQVGSTFYLYGEAHSCGFTFTVTSAWCGINLYSSTDLNVWHLVGSIVDQTDSGWKTRCNSVASTNAGCFRPKLFVRPSDSHFILWMWAPTPTPSNGYYTADCGLTLGVNVCAYSTSPTPSVSPGAVGDANFMVDSGTVYIIYSNSTGTRCPYISALNAATTDFTGSSTQIVSSCGAGIEAVGLFKKGSTYYATYGQLCDYCTSTDTTYSTASTPLGSWTNGSTLTASSCNGQNVGTFVLTINSATVYLYISTQPPGESPLSTDQNESQANMFFHAMTFTGSTPDAITCDATITFALTPTAAPTIYPAVDQSDEQTTPGFLNYCNITATTWINQPFTPTVTGTVILRLPVAPSLNADGNFLVKLVTLDGSSNPASTLATVTIPRAGLPLAPTIQTVNFGVSGTAGTTYGIVIAANNTQGCYSYAYASTAPYASPAKFTTNAGSSWVAFSPSGTNIMFSNLVVPIAKAGPGHSRLH